MINVLISGALGKMGKKVFTACTETDTVKAVCGVDIVENFSNADFPIYADFDSVKEKVDVIIDFSSPLNFERLSKYIEKTGTPAVLCATGYSEEQNSKVNELSKKVAIFRSANMSLGVNLLETLVKTASLVLEGFDIEITEMHHNKKVDAPSGTAFMLAEAVKSVLPEKFFLYGREGKVGARTKDEIGIHALRGGNVVGEHEVIFAGENEIIKLSHSASDRSVFADGAVKASQYIVTKKSGLYNMSDMINGK